MAKIGLGKSAGWVAIIVFSRLLTVIAQPGFLSIRCGSNTSQTDENNIIWVTDAQYIGVGETADTGNATLSSYSQSLRYFPKSLKSCYRLPVVPKLPHLLRCWFAPGNYTGFPELPIYSFNLSFETQGMRTVMKVMINNTQIPISLERIFVSSGNELYICLIKTSETDFPFINAIELRTLQDGMYRPQAKPGTMLKSTARVDVGGNMSIRYPHDKFDRIWQTDSTLQFSGSDKLVQKLNSHKQISINNTVNLPPSIVMQTAWVTSYNASITFSVAGTGGTTSLLVLYFAEVNPNMSETRSFDVSVNSELELPEPLSIVRNYSASEVQLPVSSTDYSFAIVSDSKSSYGPILNAFEHFVIITTDPPTSMEDINALGAIKTSFDIKSWISDPCYAIEWEGIGCDKSFPARRISEINLSGMNLTGLVPQNIGQLTALVNVSLDNNHLTGPLPNFSTLTMLERLHLQNNNLNGTVPDWLAGLKNLTELSLDNNHLTGPLPNFSTLTILERLHLQNNNLNGTVPDWLAGLKNLRELFIDNNNFSGEIPEHLLKASLKFSHAGNGYLYTPSNSDKDTLKRLILGIAISGSLVVIALLSIVGVLVHRKKSRRKESSKLEKESKHAVDEDNSMIIVPNTAKSRAFTLEEIMKATQDFSQKIGQGGFGSVFFGKLEQGTNIAVKVLSMFSKQGVQEFLNEVDLLSKVDHRNLVSLLGYCIESRELMLVYEHMSGGSLKDHLYGATADLCQLNWKTRLKIAADAAQGLEYLHVGCTQKIIHRDIKTANILLDTNFIGKLADFGLSRVTIDGEASHVTTTVKGTIGYLDPEYFSTQMLTEKSDVYSFGVVLLEIICGRQPINAKLTGEQLNLIRWVTPYVEMDENPDKISEIIDKRLVKNYDIESITEVAKLAIRCVQMEPSSRPHVSEIVAELKEAIKLEKDKASLVSEIDIEYDDLSIASSGPKTMESAESSSSKLTTVPQEGR